MKKHTLGLIGPGSFGSFLLRAYSQLPEIKIKAVSGKNEEKLKKISQKFKIEKYYLDYQKLLEDKEIEIVVIATPPYLHSQMIIKAAYAKKNILAEKPLCLDLKEADKIKKAISKNKVKFMIDYLMRYNPLYQKAKEMIENKTLGRLKRVVFENYAKDLPKNHWFWDERKSGGIFVEHGVHFFDIYNFISSQKPLWIWATKKAKEVFSFLEYPSFSLSFYHAFYLKKELERTESRLVFENGYLTLSGWIPTKMEIKEKKIDLGKKEKVYQKACQDVLLDLVQSIENEKHKVKAGLEEAIEGLNLALLAKKSSLKKEVLKVE